MYGSERKKIRQIRNEVLGLNSPHTLDRYEDHQVYPRKLWGKPESRRYPVKGFTNILAILPVGNLDGLVCGGQGGKTSRQRTSSLVQPSKSSLVVYKSECF